jgi:hypothetical protein
MAPHELSDNPLVAETSRSHREAETERWDFATDPLDGIVAETSRSHREAETERIRDSFDRIVAEAVRSHRRMGGSGNSLLPQWATAQKEFQMETEISPMVLAAAQLLVAKQAKLFEKARQNAAAYGEWVQPETLEFDAVAQKNRVLCTCIETGEEFWSYTSDLFQIGGLCPSVRKARKAKAKQVNKALIEQAKELIKAGKVQPTTDESEGDEAEADETTA